MNAMSSFVASRPPTPGRHRFHLGCLGHERRQRLHELLRRRASFAATEIASNWPFLRKRPCAVGTSKTANVAPPIESTDPNLAMPVISYCSTGPRAATLIVSPTS